MLRKLLFTIVIILIVLVGIRVNDSKDKPSAGKPAKTSSAPQSISFDKARYSTTDSTSPWVIVNKQHPLNPKTYIPVDLVIPAAKVKLPGDETMKMRKEAASAVEAMFGSAKTDGINLMLVSDYRSYSNQLALYNSYVRTLGQTETDRSSARAGYSEHQTGWATDVGASSRKCEIDQCFADTPEGQWVAANAYKYGFIVRYPKDKESVTGYEYEPWHLRYIGTYLATEMHNKAVTTLEEFFSITGGSSY